MTKIVYVRHGETAWNIAGRYQGQTNVELSDKGREQAARLAAHFPVPGITAIYSSSLVRAQETAAAVGAKLSLPVTPLDALKELNFGDWEGLTYEQIVNGWPKAIEDFFQRPDILEIPNGETFPKLQQRALSCIHSLIQKHPGETIAVFAHGAILRTILTAALHMDLRYVWTIRQFNTAVSIVRYDEDDNTSVELLNSTAHLQM